MTGYSEIITLLQKDNVDRNGCGAAFFLLPLELNTLTVTSDGEIGVPTATINSSGEV